MSAEVLEPVQDPTRKRPRYPLYNQTSITWCEHKPTHWHVKRLKYLAKINMGQSPGSEECNLEGLGLPFLQGNAEFGREHPTATLHCATARKRALPGDILLSVRAPVGALNVADQQYGIGRGLCAITPDQDLLNHRYGRYLLEVARVLLHAEATGSTYDAVDVERVQNLPCLVPTAPEQKAIAVFLDRETAKIDALVSKREQLIALSEEKRAALITHAVTEGLNPTVPMKASGNAAVAQVPSHWKVRRNRRVFREVDERSVTGLEELLTVSHITGVTPRSEKEVYMFLADSTEGYKVCRAGDLAINTMWAYMGAVGIAWQEGIVSPSYNVYRPREKGEYSPYYLDYLYRTPPYICEINRHSKGIWKSRLRLYPDAFFEMCTLTPPLEEQELILQYIERQCGLTDAFTGKLRDSIECLREYRTALISAAVTGKIDVRGQVA